MFAQLGGAINALLGGSKKRSVRKNKKSKNAKRSQMKHRGGGDGIDGEKKEMMGGNKSRSNSKSRSQRRRGGAFRSGSVIRK